MRFILTLIWFLSTILAQKCYSPLKPFPKLWGYEVDDTEVQSFAVNAAGSEFYLGVLTKEQLMHGDTLSNTQHLIMKYGLNSESTGPIWSKKVPQSNLGPQQIQVFLFQNE